MGRKNHRSNKSGSAILPAVLAVIFIMNAMAGDLDGATMSLLAAIAVLAGIIALMVLMVKISNRPGGVKKILPGKSREKSVEDMPLSSAGSRSSAVYNPRSAEELFLRDKQKRLEQLDVFLKNGIVDKAEYELLKKRYENYSYERN